METTVLGKPLNRIDGRKKVTGTARYAADLHPKDCAYAFGIRSAIASGEVKSIDASRAERAPGVLAVLHVFNAPKFFRCPDDMQVGERRPPFEDSKVYYAGQFVAVVVAETFAQARWASHLVEVRYSADGEHIVDFETAMQKREPQDKDEQSRGTPSEAYESADVKTDVTYTTPVETHNAMELHAAVAKWENGRLIVEDSTQWVVGQSEALARTFGLAKSDVEVHSRFIGGGFGSKLFLWPHSILAAEAARRLQRPVQFVLDRPAQFTTAGCRPVTKQRIQIAANREGRFQAIQHDAVTHTSLVHDYVESCADVTPSLYSCPNVRVSQKTIELNTGSPTPMRGPGETPGLWALESAIDELAAALDMDPLELRLRNLPERDEAKDLPWSSHLHERCLREAAKRFGWEKRNPAVGSMREGREILGWGIASASWPAMRSEASVRVDLLADGRARVMCATQDIGTGTYTVFGQVVSELTGLGFDRIEVDIGDSHLPEGPISGGSMVTATVVPAIAEATDKAIEKLLSAATKEGGPFAGEDVESLSLKEGRVQKSGGENSASIGEVLSAARLSYVSGDAEASPGDEQDEYSFRSFGAHCVEARWDPGMGTIRLSRVTSVIDAGRIINHKTARNQVFGAIVMGLGMGLLEETVYDQRTGRVVTDNIADYLMPVNTDTPEMDLTLLDVPDPYIGRFGARGIGEIGLTGVAPAIASAVYHATGRRVRDLPITVDKLLAKS